MKEQSIPTWVIDHHINLDVALLYSAKYGNLDYFKSAFLNAGDVGIAIKDIFRDYAQKVDVSDTLISFAIINDASVANRRYHESYVCQTPMLYAYEDLTKLYQDKIPKVRQRNAIRTYLEPLIPYECANYLILKALIEATKRHGSKQISFSITSKSIRVNYSYDESSISQSMIDIKKEYFALAGIDYVAIEKAFDDYIRRHRAQFRYSYFNGMMTLEVLYNVRKNTFKKYAVSLDNGRLLTKAEYDILNFVRDRGGATLKLIAEEFNYGSTRAVKYHMDKLIQLNLAQRVGANKSHDCFYRTL